MDAYTSDLTMYLYVQLTKLCYDYPALGNQHG